MIRKLIFNLSILLVPIELLVCISNYLIDPANIFSSQTYVNGIAEILSKGNNVENIRNYNERILQEEMILRLRKTPDVVVLGSSRIMEIGSDFFPGKSLLNIGVSHGNIHDLIALVGLLDSCKRIPSEMIINVDMFLVAPGGTKEWQDLSEYYIYLSRKIGESKSLDKINFESNKFNKLIALFSFNYFKSSIGYLTKGVKNKYYNVAHRIPSNGRFYDGTIKYPDTYAHLDTISIARESKATGLKAYFSGPDSTNVVLLIKLLTYLKLNNVKIELVMLPFHPEYFKAICLKQPNVFEDYSLLFKRIAQKNNVCILGGFDANDFGLSGSDFYDMYHCSKKAIHKVVENL